MSYIDTVGNTYCENQTYLFMDSPCPNNEDNSDIDNNIHDILAMLDHFIQQNNKEEIAFCRQMLQSAKLYKRSLVNS